MKKIELFSTGVTDYDDALTPVFTVFLLFKAVYDVVFFHLSNRNFSINICLYKLANGFI